MRPLPCDGGSGGPGEELLKLDPVLIVDDKEENRYSLKRVLEKEQFLVETVTSGKEALRHLLNNGVSLILMDVQMPEMNGFEVVQEIRQNLRHQDVPVIFVTAVYRSSDFVDYGYSVGGYDYLTKPVDPRLLVNKVRLFQTLHIQRKALERSRRCLLEERAARREAEAREQYAAYQAGIAEMTASVIHTIGNSVQGLDGTFFELTRTVDQVAVLQQALQQQIQRLQQARESAEGGRAEEEAILQYVEQLPELMQSAIIEPCGNPKRKIEDAIERISRTIRVQQRSDYSRRLCQEFSVETLFHDLAVLVGGRLRESDVRMQQYLSEVPPLYLPRSPLLQSLVQLIQNSIESIAACRAQLRRAGEKAAVGEIGLYCSSTAEMLKIEVVDDGEGIASEQIRDCFTFGFSTRPAQSGIGLYSVGHFISGCRGSIELLSDQQRRETRVVLLLPLHLESIVH